MEAPKEKNETKNFYIFLVMALVLADLLMVFILLENLLVLPQSVIQMFAAVTILTIFLPLLIVIRSELQKSDNIVQGDQFKDAFSDQRKSKIELESCCEDINSASVEISIPVTEGKSAESSNEVLGADSEKQLKGKWPQRGEDHTIVQALMSLDLWILFLATTCGLGSTITVIDNMWIGIYNYCNRQHGTNWKILAILLSEYKHFCFTSEYLELLRPSRGRLHL